MPYACHPSICNTHFLHSQEVCWSWSQLSLDPDGVHPGQVTTSVQGLCQNSPDDNSLLETRPSVATTRPSLHNTATQKYKLQSTSFSRKIKFCFRGQNQLFPEEFIYLFIFNLVLRALHLFICTPEGRWKVSHPKNHCLPGLFLSQGEAVIRHPVWFSTCKDNGHSHGPQWTHVWRTTASSDVSFGLSPSAGNWKQGLEWHLRSPLMNLTSGQ